MKKLLSLSLFTTLMACSSFASADVITYGHLQTDTDGSIIADTNLGREYLRFDEFDMTVAQTFAAVETGGLYEGWSIADSDISDDFIFGLLGGNQTCAMYGELNTNGELCGTIAGWTDGMFGTSYYENNFRDIFAFVSTQNTGNVVSTDLGAVAIDNPTGAVTSYDDWIVFSQLDAYYNESAINLLLYRDAPQHIGGINANQGTTSVPVPAAYSMLLLGLAGFGARRKNIKK